MVAFVKAERQKYNFFYIHKHFYINKQTLYNEKHLRDAICGGIPNETSFPAVTIN